MSIYTIEREIQATIDELYSRVDENGELIDVTAEDLKAIEQLNADRDTKLENIALYIKNLDAEAAAIQAEEIALKKRREAIERKSDGLRGVLISSMNAHNETEKESPRYKAKISRSESTEITDMSILPKKFIRKIKPEIQYKPDKVAIKEVLKSGKAVKGAFLKVTQKVKIS